MDNSNADDQSNWDNPVCLKPDSRTVLIEVAINGELLAYQEGG